MNPIIVSLIIELILRIVLEFLDKNVKGVEDLKVGEVKVMHGLLDVIDNIQPYMSVKQHRRCDNKIKRIRELVG